jgi:hypothetical protein
MGIDLDGRIGLAGAAQGQDAVVVILDPASGVEVRRTVVSDAALRPAVALGFAFGGDGVVVGGSGGDGKAFVARITPDGGLGWQRVVATFPGNGGWLPTRVVIAADGTVVAGFNAWTCPHVLDGFTFFSLDGFVFGLDAADGAVRWQRTLDGDASVLAEAGVAREPYGDPYDQDFLSDLAVTRSGDVVALGTTSWIDSGSDVTIVAVSAEDGGNQVVPGWNEVPPGEGDQCPVSQPDACVVDGSCDQVCAAICQVRALAALLPCDDSELARRLRWTRRLERVDGLLAKVPGGGNTRRPVKLLKRAQQQVETLRKKTTKRSVHATCAAEIEGQLAGIDDLIAAALDRLRS